MRFRNLCQKTSKTAGASETSKNAQLLLKAGYVHQLMAGVYTYLPLGLRVLTKIEAIVREEMNAIDGQEILMPVLQPREAWEATGRWDEAQDVLFTLKGTGDRDLALGATHEEIVTPLIRDLVQSYRDLPVSVYQIQSKFRKEARAKSGILRGREFKMKDMYSFHTTQQDLDAYYERAIEAYTNVYRRCGIGERTYLTTALGGMFSRYSHEFQTITEAGEDLIYLMPDGSGAVNKEIIDDDAAMHDLLPDYVDVEKQKTLKTAKAVEVGNIFKLGVRYSKPVGARFATPDGKTEDMIMGCYGIGITRLMGAVVECLGDEKGLVWPEEIAPFAVHLVVLGDEETEKTRAESLYQDLKAAGVDVLFDDRNGLSAGAKLADADLLGIPHRLVISKKTLAENAVEWKKRTEAEARTLPLTEAITLFAQKHP